MKPFEKRILYFSLILTACNFIGMIFGWNLSYSTITKNDKIVIEGAADMSSMVLDGASKMDSIIIVRMMSKIEALESKIEAIENGK